MHRRQENREPLVRSDFFHIQAEWGPREENVEACGRRVSRMLDELSDVHRGFTEMIVDADWRRNRPAGALPRRAAEIVPYLSRLRAYDGDLKRYFVQGYQLSAASTLGHGRYLSLAILAGIPERWSLMNQVSVSFNVLDDANDDNGLAAVIPVTLALISAWAPQTASAVSTRYGELSPAAGDAPPFVHGTWTAYFARGVATSSLAPSGVTRHLPDGGLLWCASDQPFDLDNPVHLHAAAAMHASLTAE